MNAPNKFTHIKELARKGQFEAAEQAIKTQLGHDDAHHLDALILLGRCQLAQDKLTEALHTYQHLQGHKEPENAAGLGEAALVQDDFKTAQAFLEEAAQVKPRNADVWLLLAAAEYRLGFVAHAAKHMQTAIREGQEWEDDDPIDMVLRQALPLREFHDFEHIYLDAHEFIHDDNENPQNRWFALNMPVYELLVTDRPDLQKKRALALATLLSPEFDTEFLAHGKENLKRILEDLAASPRDAEFGRKGLKALEKGDLPEISKLVLAVLLEHIKQFARYFGLSPKFTKETALQNLAPLLPLRIAVALMFLYSTSDPRDQLDKLHKQPLNPEHAAALIAATFITFYQQVELYRDSEKEHYETGYT